MTIERWDPFRDMISLRDAMNSLLAESFVRPGGPPDARRGRDAAPRRRRDGGRVRDQGVAAGHQARGRAHHRPRRHAHDPGREQGRGGEEGHALARARTSRQLILALNQPGHADPRRRGERPVRSRRPDADLAQVGRVQAEADQGGERPEAATVERSSGAYRSGNRTNQAPVKHDSAHRPPNPGGKPEPTHNVAAEQAREAHEAEAARNAVASNRERMVDIGRGNQQAGRQGQ